MATCTVHQIYSIQQDNLGGGGEIKPQPKKNALFKVLFGPVSSATWALCLCNGKSRAPFCPFLIFLLKKQPWARSDLYWPVSGTADGSVISGGAPLAQKGFCSVKTGGTHSPCYQHLIPSLAASGTAEAVSVTYQALILLWVALFFQACFSCYNKRGSLL